MSKQLFECVYQDVSWDWLDDLTHIAVRTPYISSTCKRSFSLFLKRWCHEGAYVVNIDAMGSELWGVSEIHTYVSWRQRRIIVKQLGRFRGTWWSELQPQGFETDGGIGYFTQFPGNGVTGLCQFICRTKRRIRTHETKYDIRARVFYIAYSANQLGQIFGMLCKQFASATSCVGQ